METQLYSVQTPVSKSWILFDTKGESNILDLDKYDILRMFSIHARDQRILDPLMSYPPTILGREKAIVLNLEHIKAIITSEEMLLCNPLDDAVLPVVEELQRRLPTALTDHDEEENDADTEKQSEYPFEFRALDVALRGICSYLDVRAIELECSGYPALDELTSKISSRNLDRMRKIKSSMSKLFIRVQKVREELEQLLEDEDDMADLYLTRKKVNSSPVLSGHGKYDVDDLELLLEDYFMQIDSTMGKLTTLREFINGTEDYINIQMDNRRNQLLQLCLFLNISTLCLTVYSLVTAILSMNIPFTWWKGGPSYAYLFKWVVILTGVASASIFIAIVSYARRKGLVGS